MELEYSSFDAAARCSTTPPSMLRERAAAHGIDLRVEVAAGHRPGLLRRAAAQAGRAQPDDERGEVHRRRRLGGGPGAPRPAPRSTSPSPTPGSACPTEDRERIFESFQQGGRGSSREEGTGLGLTLSRRIVELLGGRMWLESEVGVGSTFGFSLAAARDRDERAAPDAGGRPVGDVVVIEDDRPSLDLITAYLSGAALRGHRGAGRPVRAGRRATGAAGRRPAGHPAAGHRRVGGAAGAEGRAGDPRHPGDRRVDRRRAGARRRARGRGLSGQAGQPRRRCSPRWPRSACRREREQPDERGEDR